MYQFLAFTYITDIYFIHNVNYNKIEVINMDIGKMISTYRHQRKMTLKDLAIATGLSLSFISDIEHGRSKPRLDNLQTIAKALLVPVNEFLKEETRAQLKENEEFLTIYDSLTKEEQDDTIKFMLYLRSRRP